MKRLFAGTLTAMLALSLTACGQQEQGDAKPVIYLYPEQETTVSVSLDYAGTLIATYPAYENGWTVTAEPDGTLYDENGNEYSYLFWEARTTPTTTSPRASASLERTQRIFSAKTGRDRLDTARVQRIYRVLAAEKCRITRTTLFRSSPRRTQMPPS